MRSAFPETVKILAAQIGAARVDHAAFETLLKPCEMSQCRATCCHDGVHLSEEEAEHLCGIAAKYRQRLLEYGLSLPESVIIGIAGGQKTAIREADDEELAADFPAHFPKTRCVFLDRQGFCGIQKLSMEMGRDAWFDKPLTCWMHPLVLIPAGKWEERPVLTLVNNSNDPQKRDGYPGYGSCTHCGRADAEGSPAWQVLAPELRRLGDLCGRNIYAELTAPECDWEIEA